MNVSKYFKSAILSLFLTIAINAKADNQAVLSECSTWYDLAVMVMTERQKSESIHTLLNLFNGEVERVVVMMAYDRPLYGSGKMKTQEIKEFANLVFLVCYNNKKAPS